MSSVLAIRALISSALLCVSVVAQSAAELDPLAVAFGTMPALWGARISPDGSMVSFLQMHSEDLSVLGVLDLTTGKSNIALASTRDGFNLQWCDWANNERLLCSFAALSRAWGPFQVTRLVAVNADGSKTKVLLQHKVEGNYSQFLDEVVDWMVDDPEHILAAIPNWMPGSVDVYRAAHASSRGFSARPVDIYSGEVGAPVETLSGYVSWRSDGRGLARLYWRINKTYRRWKYRRSGERKWRDLHKAKISDLDDHYYPIGFGQDLDRLLVVKPHEARLALWSVDLKGERDDELIFSHPDVDVGDTVTLGKFKRIVAIEYATDRSYLHFFDQAVENISKALEAYFSDKTVEVIGESWNRRYYLLNVATDRDPGALYRFDAEKKKLLKISPRYPLLEARPLSPMKAVRYAARDGTEIPGYLTLPADAEGPLAAVILPHGGPQSRDYWEFDWLAQYLSAKGYAVLQSNYRGSGGYGSDWAGEGGFRAWRTAINDLADGAEYLVEQGVVDPARVCVVGWSYGGYAALMSGVENPERYRCLVSIAGVTDPEMLIEDYKYVLNKAAVQKFIGRDYEVLDRGSPLNRASEIRAPVLLFHGDEDVNVQIHHSEKLAKALERAKKPVEYIEYEGAEHSILRNGYRVDMLDRIGSFLDRHIGQAAAAP
ncbi:MAG: S9 family peptidase [Deltaproteobacteria bacterium]|jgi:dipeptidyl aminopeptidase/acylaminoacyl peptidase|nr:S9 family peptidase [Deltaproteobacteria bacterium]